MVNLTAFVEHTNQVFPIDLPSDFPFIDFKAYLSAECNIDPTDQIILLDNKEIIGEEDGITIGALGFKDGDFFTVKQKRNSEINSFATGGNLQNNQTFDNPSMYPQFEASRLQLLGNSNARQQIQQHDPELIQVIDDPIRFRQALISRMSILQQQQTTGSNAELARLSQDPENPENQRRIMELIELQNIEENMANALELTPESFTKVDMLYIHVEINGLPIKAFVDSGAQATIITPSLAEKSGLYRLIDRRFKGIAKGVGSGEIIGRIHSAPLKIGDTFIPCSFTVLDTNVDMLLGLDMLRRHQANIDLKNNVLKIADTETPFLIGSEVPNDFDQEKLAQTIGDQIDTTINTNHDSQKIQKLSVSSSKDTPAKVAAAQAALNRNATTNGSISRPIAVPNEQSITQLIGLGFSRAESIKALNQADGNVDIAAAILFQ